MLKKISIMQWIKFSYKADTEDNSVFIHLSSMLIQFSST